MRPKMEDKKTTDDVPAAVFTSAQNGASEQTPKQKSKRKYLIIAGSAVLAIAIILAAILVGMYLFTEGQKEILKFSYKRDDGVKEDVTSDPNTNIVQFHVTDKMYEMWVIDDFSKDIQVMKIVRDSNTNCYVAPLNRTMAMDPSKVSAPADQVPSSNTSVAYRASTTTIPDSSFLSKTAKDACKGISTYWVYPMCNDPKDDKDQSRVKRYYWCNYDYSCCYYCFDYYWYWYCYWVC